MPPPPASRRAAVQRNLRVGTISSAAVQTSIAGLAVKVTMDSMALPFLRVHDRTPRPAQY
jgi:hypothetical protein